MTTNDLITIPKSVTPERIKENIAALDITLEATDLQKIDALAQTERLINPDFNEFDY